VDLLLEWGALDGAQCFQAFEADPQGLTALHLAACLPDGGAMARLLLDALPDAPHAWEAALAADGLSPANYAALAAGDLAAEEASSEVRGSSGPCRARCWACCHVR
jgi:hypothetical protein